jgi:hypothetical protein
MFHAALTAEANRLALGNVLQFRSSFLLALPPTAVLIDMIFLEPSLI